jgi:hypothetical protein
MDKLDVTQMVAMIYQRAFGLVIFRAQFYPPPVLNAIGQNYDVVEHIPMNGFLYAVLRPKPERAQKDADVEETRCLIQIRIC